MFETRPIESLVYPGYYHCPIVDWVLVSPEGKVIDTLAKVSLIPTKSIDNKTYPMVYIPSFRTIAMHRLMAYTFLKCPGDPEEYQVNHKNGIKADFALDNLEWVTASENAAHAYETGLRKDNRHVLIKNLVDGTVQEFHSLQATARFFKVNGSVIHRYLNNRDDAYPFKLRWDVIYSGEKWRGLTKADIGTVRRGLPKPVVTIGVKDKLITLYESGVHLAADLGVSQGVVSLWLINKRVPEKRGFKVYYLHECQNMLLGDIVEKTFDKSHYKPNRLRRRKPVPVEVTNTTTNEVIHWDSTEAFANSLGVKKNTIQRSVLKNDGKWKHYKLKYLTVVKKGCPTTSK